MAPEQIQTMSVDATLIALAQSDAMPIEEVENLDRHLAAIVESVAELRSRKRAVASLTLDRSAMIVVISLTVDRKKKWSCATSSAQPMRPTRLRARRRSFSARPVVAARSRTLGGRKRCAPPRSGAIISQAALSSGASCTSCDGSLTNAPSKTRRPETTSFFKARSNAGFGSLGCDVTRSCSRPKP